MFPHPCPTTHIPKKEKKGQKWWWHFLCAASFLPVLPVGPWQWYCSRQGGIRLLVWELMSPQGT